MEGREYLLDMYGNNAAVRCPSCLRVFIVSKWINRQRGRACPGCGKSRAIFAGESVSIHEASAETGDLDNDPLLRLIGSGQQVWADEHADEYVENLRRENP